MSESPSLQLRTYMYARIRLTAGSSSAAFLGRHFRWCFLLLLLCR